MYRKESSNKTVTFYYKRDALFNDVSLMSNFMAKNLATKEGNSLTDEFAISDDEKDLFGVCVQQTLPDIYEAMAKITSGVSSAFEDNAVEATAEEHSITVGSEIPANTYYVGKSEADVTHNAKCVLAPNYNEYVYLASDYASGTAVANTRYFAKSDVEFVEFQLQDNGAYNENILTLVDASLYNAIKHGVLKEFYSTVIQADFFKVCSDRFIGELFKLKQRLFQLKKKSVVSSLS